MEVIHTTIKVQIRLYVFLKYIMTTPHFMIVGQCYEFDLIKELMSHWEMN